MESLCALDYKMVVSDPEILAGAMHGADLRPCQISRRPGASELIRVNFRSSCLDLMRFGSAMLFTGTTASDCYTLVFVLDCPDAGHSFNFSLEHHEDYLAYFPSGGFLDARTPENYRNAIFSVQAEPFLRLVKGLYPEIPDSFISKSAALRVPDSVNARLRGLLQMTWNIQDQSPYALDSQHARSLLEDQLLDAFLSAFGESYQRPGQRPRALQFRREMKFRHIRDYLSDHLDRHIGLPDICAEADLSARAVEELFHDYLGISPNAFFRHLRLHAAKRALADYRAVEFGIIKKVALDHGFWHLGRFSGYYSELFGEMPSATLARGAR